LSSIKEKIFGKAAVEAKGAKPNWRTSIVDLMKALDLDSSLAARKELAADLNYTGTDPDGSAEKNTWLHKELMKTLAENGGEIPKELLA
jgi:non-homologous end joining protein Ku